MKSASSDDHASARQLLTRAREMMGEMQSHYESRLAKLQLELELSQVRNVSCHQLLLCCSPLPPFALCFFFVCLLPLIVGTVSLCHGVPVAVLSVLNGFAWEWLC